MSYDWQKLDGAAAEKLLAEINPNIAPVPFHPERTTVRTQKLPFYKDYALYELTDHDAVPAARKYALHKPGNAEVIDWTNAPIYDVNAKAPVLLTERTVAAYAKFFFAFVRGRKGRFQLVESIDDIRWQSEPPLQGRKMLQEMLTPVDIIAHDKEGNWQLQAFLIFKDALFRANISINPRGLVAMSEEEAKVEGLPVLQDAA